MTRILSVVTLVTPSGDYGGPVRVAVNQAKRSPTVAMTCRSSAGTRATHRRRSPSTGCRADCSRYVGSSPARFSGLIAPALIGWLIGNVAGFDAVHVHVARD